MKRLSAKLVIAATAAVTGFASILAFQNWYTVRYIAADQVKSLLISGVSAFPLVPALLWLGLIAVASLMFLRGWLRTSLLSLAGIAMASCWASLLPQLQEGIPQLLTSELEKTTGLTLVTHADLGGVVKSVSGSPLGEWFLALTVFLFGLTALGAFASLHWGKVAKPDRFVVSSSNKTDATPSQDSKIQDPISLWDSQS